MTNGHTATAQPQGSFDEEPLDNPELEKLLEDWAAKKERLKPVRKAFNTINATVKERIEQAELPNGSYRVGPFVVSIKPVEEREISFERTASKRISIKPAKT